jgi:hypothetical protein
LNPLPGNIVVRLPDRRAIRLADLVPSFDSSRTRQLPNANFDLAVLIAAIGIRRAKTHFVRFDWEAAKVIG